MDISKTSESTSSSNGETSDRGITKKNETHQKVSLPTFDKRGIQAAKL